ncbi:MAG: DUF4838 domain-containing protein, partial [Clostridiales bacterium]|nr:DUF4838 domain-containing protein [Clostridiales bacterium]
NLVLAAEGRSNYQLVVPDGTGDERIDKSLHLAARLIQAAFKASGFELPIAREGGRAPDKPGIYLGATAFALQNGCDPAALEGWDYYHKVVDPDVVIVGRDHAPPPVPAGLGDRAFFYRMATVKGVADFLRMHCGTYFLFPGGTFIPSAAATPRKDFELLLTPDIEYKPMERIEVPRDLQLRKHFFVVYNFRNTKECSLYDIANNLFPRVDDAYFAHTYDKAVPASKYRQTHPEYFALQGGERTTQNHYCISNPGFQETLFQWTKQWLDLGFKSVNILHQDGFRPCQCADCAALYGTGTDWGEKLWIMQRNMAERLWKEHPGKTFLMVPYTVTQNPPASFDEFPSNVAIRAQGTNLEAFEPWKRFEARRNLPIPRGFASGLHNWIANQSSSYTPQRTPLFVEQQVRMFHANNVTATTRDGQGYMFGLEGPTFYVFGRMFDDPEKLDAKTLLFEFCDAAFGNAAPSMRHFYDALYDSIEIYALYLSTHGIAWSYTDIYGRRHKAIRDPFRMLGFLYPPRLLNTLEQHLAQAEAQARADKHKARLRLVRRELDYLKATLRVVHLHHAYEIEPNLAARDRLLDAIDARNKFLGSIFTFRPRRQGDGASPAPIDGWDHVLFPRPGHSPAHLRLAYNDYGNPFENTAFNWDTAAVRSAPLPGTERQTALAAPGAVSIDTPLWDTAPAAELKPAMPSGKTMPATAFRVLHGPEHVHLLIRAGLARGQSAFDDAGRDGKMNGAEAVDVYLAPDPAREVFYRFTVGPHPGSKYDAARGLIADQMHPRFNLDDPDWNGEWTYESRLDPRGRLWTALLSIPYSTLETVRPTEDATWRVNVARTHVPAPDQLEQAIWSTLGSTRNVGDRNALGELIFRAGIET